MYSKAYDSFEPYVTAITSTTVFLYFFTLVLLDFFDVCIIPLNECLKTQKTALDPVLSRAALPSIPTQKTKKKKASVFEPVSIRVAPLSLYPKQGGVFLSLHQSCVAPPSLPTR